jgi:hypothetical protein
MMLWLEYKNQERSQKFRKSRWFESACPAGGGLLTETFIVEEHVHNSLSSKQVNVV